MYNSPIDLCTTIPDVIKKIDRKTGEEIYKAVMNIGISVDKEELLRALQYDRDQYYKGYYEGYRDKANSIVHCKACKHFTACEEVDGVSWTGFCNYGEFHTDEDDFCSRGERKDNEEHNNF